ncbi:hypothetical protein [Salinimicrobium oceani]|uniref:Peptidase propeptide and YPEB domain-containing protein n=1 Tax=Salinimicrobium oceani TaxID=2722702 RepID=A0ABX1D1I0_9FLAO|nr:hypothetical protein [Salinimicrobium oceani]NJW52989.1 hypothetical protein [Salinimicrobium oceani]
MKKICLTVLAASALIFSTQTVSAQEVAQANVEVEETVTQRVQDDFRQIEIEELPAEVQQAVERDFAGATIAEAHVKEHEGEQKFKLKVTTAEGEEKELYADAQGNWIDKEKKHDENQDQE